MSWVSCCFSVQIQLLALLMQATDRLAMNNGRSITFAPQSESGPTGMIWSYATFQMYLTFSMNPTVGSFAFAGNGQAGGQRDGIGGRQERLAVQAVLRRGRGHGVQGVRPRGVLSLRCSHAPDRRQVPPLQEAIRLNSPVPRIAPVPLGNAVRVYDPGLCWRGPVQVLPHTKVVHDVVRSRLYPCVYDVCCL